MSESVQDGEDQSRDGTQYRVSGYWGGEWQETEWTDDYESVCEEFFDVYENKYWLQITLERKGENGIERKAGPDGSDWHSKESGEVAA